MGVFIKSVIVIFFSCVLVTGCQSNARQEDDIENVLINSNIDNDISQNEHRMCDYLSSKYEEYLSELEGIETVNCFVEYDEENEEYSIKVIVTVSSGFEDISDEIEPVLYNEFSNVDIQVDTK